MSTQLTNPATFDVSNMIFGKAIAGSAGGANASGPAIKYFRIPISVRNPDGSVGELVFQTEKLFSFGVSVNTDQQSGNVTGYTFPLCLWNKDGATDAEKAFCQAIDDVIEKSKDHLVLEATKVEIKKFQLKRDGLDSLGNFKYRKVNPENGKIIDDKGPVLYPKLIESKKANKIITEFFDEKTGNLIDPMTLQKKYCWAKAAIKIESIYVGAKISLQVKVYEAEVSLVESGAKRLLQRPRSDARVTVAPTPSFSMGGGAASALAAAEADDQEAENDGENEAEENDEIHDEESAQPVKPATPPPAPVVEAAPARKIVRKIQKK